MESSYNFLPNSDIIESWSKISAPVFFKSPLTGSTHSLPSIISRYSYFIWSTLSGDKLVTSATSKSIGDSSQSALHLPISHELASLKIISEAYVWSNIYMSIDKKKPPWSHRIFYYKLTCHYYHCNNKYTLHRSFVSTHYNHSHLRLLLVSRQPCLEGSIHCYHSAELYPHLQF